MGLRRKLKVFKTWYGATSLASLLSAYTMLFTLANKLEEKIPLLLLIILITIDIGLIVYFYEEGE